MSKQEYTVIVEVEGGYLGWVNSRYARCDDLPSLVEHQTRTISPEEWVRAAWAATIVPMSDSDKARELLSESIAAGRLIEKTASGWVALGAEKQERASLCEHECAEEVLGGNACADACGALIPLSTLRCWTAT